MAGALDAPAGALEAWEAGALEATEDLGACARGQRGSQETGGGRLTIVKVKVVSGEAESASVEVEG